MHVGEHVGFKDVFVPIDTGEPTLRGVVVAGPVAASYPASADVVERWYALTKSKARAADPAFLRYLARTLGTLTLDSEQFGAFSSLLSCFARMLAERGDAAELAREVDAQSRIAMGARFAERMWRTARTLVEPSTTPDWAVHEGGEMTILGLDRFPEHVLVGLLSSRPGEADPVGDILRRSLFQRACVELARKYGNLICGQLADRGVFLLAHCSASAPRVDSSLRDIAARTTALARRFGLKLHAGIGRSTGGAPLHACYESALLSSERALLQDTRFAEGQPLAQGLSEHLRQLRRELGAGILEKPELVGTRFDRYVEAVLAHSGYRVDIVRVELEAGLERLIEPLLRAGLVEPRTQSGWFAALEHSAETSDVVTAYRQVVHEVERVLESPTLASQTSSVKRAAAYLREHSSERINLQKVAHAAGLAPAHLWRLFKREHGVSCAQYLRRLRLDEARQLLQASHLGIDQVRILAGFPSRTTFFRAFRRATGMTPLEYRDSV
jgi:AraC-like DNA-binding protein